MLLGICWSTVTLHTFNLSAQFIPVSFPNHTPRTGRLVSCLRSYAKDPRRNYYRWSFTSAHRWWREKKKKMLHTSHYSCSLLNSAYGNLLKIEVRENGGGRVTLVGKEERSICHPSSGYHPLYHPSSSPHRASPRHQAALGNQMSSVNQLEAQIMIDSLCACHTQMMALQDLPKTVPLWRQQVCHMQIQPLPPFLCGPNCPQLKACWCFLRLLQLCLLLASNAEEIEIMHNRSKICLSRKVLQNMQSCHFHKEILVMVISGNKRILTCSMPILSVPKQQSI